MSVIFAIGLPGSASTWTYNVCRELLLRRFSSVSVFYSDSASGLGKQMQSVRNAALVKMHQPDAGLVAVVASGNVPAVVTLRDPRDSIVSLMERFGYSFDRAFESVYHSATQILTLRQGRTLTLRYEDRFFEKPESVFSIATLLGVDIPPDEATIIFERYTTKSVRQFMDNFDVESQGKIIESNGSRWNAETMIHATHLGDGLIGKWSNRLNVSQIDRLNDLTPLVSELGYTI